MKHTAGPLMMADLNTIGEMTLDEVAAKFPDALPKSRLKRIDIELVKIK